MNANPTPMTVSEYRQAVNTAKNAQAAAEDAAREAAKVAAQAEQAYRVELAKEIVRQHAEDKVAWTVAPDLARGAPHVAKLRYERDVAEGVREAMSQALWRHTADRKSLDRIGQWSERLELAGIGPQEPEQPQTFGRRPRAA